MDHLPAAVVRVDHFVFAGGELWVNQSTRRNAIVASEVLVERAEDDEADHSLGERG